MFRKIQIFVVLVYLAVPFRVLAEEDKERSLASYITLAAERNSGVKVAFHHWQSTISKIAYSDSIPDPNITYGHFIKSVETRVGPQKFRLGLRQMFPWLGKLYSRKDLATQEALGAEQKLSSAYVTLTLHLKEVFLEYYFLNRAIGLQKDYIELGKILEQTTQSQTKVGGSAADGIQAQMELNRLEYELISLQEQEKTVIAQINAMLNQEADFSLALPGDISALTEIPPSGLFKHSKLELVELNPYLKVIQAQVNVEEARRKLVHKNRYPDLTFGVDWIKTDHAIMSTPENGKDPVVAFVSVNIPIWRGTYESQEKEARSHLDRYSQAYEESSYQLLSQQEKILNRFSDTKRRIELYRDLLIPEAEQVLSILREDYSAGRSDFERLRNAQTALLDLQLKLERARADIGAVISQYRAMIGESL
ncbi:MAG: cobalt-zinc-cadmium efflux system outer membrane protein [Halioglobus sp.]|jgi:cobalt-zinc-cadmium efflux system outer membrane protein